MSSKLSVVTSLYRSEPYIYEFYHRVRKCIEELRLDCEFVFVDDGSPDESGSKVMALRAGDPNVHLIKLSRNHGQQRAMMAGLQHATGDYVYTVDVDLEEKPEYLLDLFQTLRRLNVDVVYGVMPERNGGFVRKFVSGCFHGLMNRLSFVKIPKNMLWSRVMTRRYHQNLLRFHEEHLYFGGLFQLVGFTQVPIPLAKSYKGSSSYNPVRRFLAAYDAFASFSVAPLNAVCGVGGAIVALCVGYGVWAVLQRLIFGIGVPGWATIVVFQTFLAGFIILFQGVIGIYVGKIYVQSKNRPLYVIQSTTLECPKDLTGENVDSIPTLIDANRRNDNRESTAVAKQKVDTLNS